MAEISLNDCGYEVYKYSLKGSHSGGNNWIPSLVIILPYTYENLPDSISFSGNYTQYRGYKMPSSMNLNLPFWIKTNSASTFQNIFLEIYSDDNFAININIDSVKWYDYNTSFKLNGNTYTQTHSISNYNYNYIALLPVFFKTTDNVILTQLNGFKYSQGDVAVGDSSYSLTITDPSENETKGVYQCNEFYILNRLTPSSTFNFKDIDSTIQKDIKTWLGLSKKYDADDPNGGSGDSHGNGGDGGDDIGGNPHKKGDLPTISALDSGLITLYNPTTEELQALGKFLWSDSFDINSFKKMFNDPFDTLLGLSIVPVKPTVSTSHSIMFGNLDSGVTANVVAKQWVSIDCGTFSLNEVWHGALDYQPSTQVSIYLPFIGVRQLNVNDVMGSVMHLYYTFDVLTGTCIAEITINHSGQGNKSDGFSYNADMGSVYTFEGQCAVNIPLASQDFTNTIRAAIGAVGMVSGAAASFAAGHPALGTAALMMGTANAEIATHTPTIERSGHLSSSSALMSSLEPCLFVQRAHICKPEKYYALRGVPSQVYVSALSQASGYFEIADVQNIHASGASDSELTEIKQLLTQGVFVDSWKVSGE